MYVPHDNLYMNVHRIIKSQKVVTTKMSYQLMKGLTKCGIFINKNFESTYKRYNIDKP